MKRHLARAEAFLRQIAELDRFWIYGSARDRSGLIHYSDSEGTAFVLMDDDDDRVEHCIELLKSRNCPIFSDFAAMDEYAEQIAKNARR